MGARRHPLQSACLGILSPIAGFNIVLVGKNAIDIKHFMYSGTSQCGHALGPSILSFVERLSSFRGYFVQSLYTMAHLAACPLFRDFSSFGVSFIGGFRLDAFSLGCLISLT